MFSLAPRGINMEEPLHKLTDLADTCFLSLSLSLGSSAGAASAAKALDADAGNRRPRISHAGSVCLRDGR